MPCSASAFELLIAISSMVLLMINPSSEAAVSSGITMLTVEVISEPLYLVCSSPPPRFAPSRRRPSSQVYYRQRYSDEPEKLRLALATLEVRLVYVQIGEKVCILAAPYMA